ncbi:flagellar hook protein FlgE [Candidatus Sulfurimonas marisnigri]|uniref:Flagellar hook protein FlgE n=1 Tax=Candidatus Sulfurimonas marisnigri TaxID=2740405 RepID=A0A7S7RQK3_9BACT|nr:flagellar hook-basal body complex protein [Candidatus Sulfurimonas marisnigri]QOY54704.1 flagellar hook protein FlgE [Candidatus Sulfurimonas marisnigri]
MMTQAFYTGLSGLRSQQQAIDVVSNNLANTSTIGFRGYSTEFSSMFEDMINTSASASSVNSSVGVGTNVNATVMDEALGVFQLTGNSTDLAILGDGWFGVQGEDKPLYTRDGSFTFDANRDLVTHDGYYVLGTLGNNINGEVLTQQLAQIPLSDVSSQEKLRLPKDLSFPAQATTNATFDGNLSLDDTVATISAGVINSQGVRNDLRLEFTKAIPQVLPGSQWDVVATTGSLDGQTIYSTQNGTVSFDERGALVSNTLSSIDNEGTSVNIDLGTNYDGVIVTANASLFSSSSDGIVAGDLLGYDINKNAEVIATFSNGQQSNIATIAVFHFANDRGLEGVNGARFSESSNSGAPIFFQDAAGNNIAGTDITNFKLEGSNVRLEAGLTDLIIMQRSYDANSKSITTADEMLKKALDMGA